MEDLDRAREVRGAGDRILLTLERFGFEWDGPVVYQSRRGELYESALDRLRRDGRIYPCSCTRSQLAQLTRRADGEHVYPGSCRGGPADSSLPMALRFNTGAPGEPIAFSDRLQGRLRQDVASEVGDFIVKRRDGFVAYQLAVVVDDAEQGVTEVVRGCDLLDNTPRQIQLQRALGLPTPDYWHLPLLTEPDGSKLAKRRRSVPLEAARAPQQLFEVLRLLRQSPPDELLSADLGALWRWAVLHWSPKPLRGVPAVHLSRPGLGSPSVWQ
jgi:glutamyl-Q tRNA(Asp) synthetase